MIEGFRSERRPWAFVALLIGWVLLLGAYWGFSWVAYTALLEAENRDLLLDMAETGARILAEEPYLPAEEIESSVQEGLRSRFGWDEVDLDPWKNPISLIQVEDNEWEWRSSGRDGEWNTRDDRFSRFQKGTVTVNPWDG